MPKHLAVTLAAALAACQSASLGAPDLDRRVAPPSTLTLRVGETKQFQGASITFIRVVEDSRCPTDVVCVWEGNAKVELGVGPAVGLGPSYQLILNTSVEPKVGTAWDLRIAVAQLDPWPRSSGPTPAKEYVLRLLISGVDANPPPGLSVTTDAGRYAPGGVVRLHLANPTARTYWFNVCHDHLERLRGSSWATVPHDRVCTAIAQELRAGTTAQASYPLERDLADGEYRIAVRLDESTVVPSSSFYIER